MNSIPNAAAGLAAPVAHAGRPTRVLFICGALHQTKQLHQVAQQMPEFEARYTPYYCDGYMELLRKAGLIDFTILGWPRRKECMRYLRKHALPMDYEGRRGGYDLVVTTSDIIIPKNIRNLPIVVVQEGITDPKRFFYWARRVLPFIPRWTAGTAYTGASNNYTVFCVASEGYRTHYAERGADPARMVATGVPILDDCARFLDNNFPHRGFCLVCTSDARETLRRDNRKVFIEKALERAKGRQLIFKLHPNEDWDRAKAEIRKWAPDALVYTHGCAEEMVANCDILICQYSTLVFVGLALGKQVHSFYDAEELKQLLPIQGGVGAANIAQVCRDVLDGQLADAQGDKRRVTPVAAEVLT